ncbi:MAG: hypothetical protein OEY89_08590 [Gammaproteobacteria bacterium]|nr:hypothetical protein [Gammaproteobacteria bacterium]
MSWIETLSHTPMPTILVISGLFFVFLAISGGVSGKVQVPLNRQRQSAIAGGILIILGLCIYIIPNINGDINMTSSDSNQSQQTGKPADNNIKQEHESNTNTQDFVANSNLQLDDWPVMFDSEYFRANRYWKEDEFSDSTYILKRKFYNGSPTLYLKDSGEGKYATISIPIDPILNFEISADFIWKKKTVINDCVGYIFRDKGSDFYLYRLCDNGRATFYSYDNENKWKEYRSTDIYQLYRQDINNLKVRCHDKKMYFFINNNLVIEMDDGNPSAGNISLYAEADDKSTIEIAVENITLKVPKKY